MFVKVCGIKKIEEIEWAIELGFTAIGLVVYEKSKRFVDFYNSIKMFNFAKGKILTVAVSLYCKDVIKFKNYADFLQVYEKCNCKNLIFATENRPLDNNWKYLLYDKSKGDGIFREFPSWILNYRDRLIIAGGLNPDNVKKVIQKIKPFGVDVSSGVEINGTKDYNLMKKFIKSVKRGEE